MKRRIGLILLAIALAGAGVLVSLRHDRHEHQADAPVRPAPAVPRAERIQPPSAEEPPDSERGIDLAPTPAEEAPSLLLEGEVVDRSGASIQGALVTIRDEPDYSFGSTDDTPEPSPPPPRTVATSDADGRFSLVVRLGTMVGVAADSFASVFWGPDRDDLPGPAHRRFVLRPARTVRGKVIDERGKPVSDASIGIEVIRGFDDIDQPSFDLPEVTCDVRGEFEAAGLPEMVVRVTASRRDEPDLAPAVRTLLPGMNSVCLVLKSPESVRAARAKLLLHIRADGLPLTERIVGVCISEVDGGLGGENIRHAADPLEYQCTPGPLTLGIKVDGFLFHSSAIELAPGETRELDVELDRGLTFSGRLLTADGSPVGDATVTIDTPEAHHMPVDESGRFSQSGLPPGRHKVRVSREGRPHHLDITPDTIELRERTEEIELRVKVPQEITIKVLFVSEAGDSVEVESDGWYTEGGSFQLESLPPGKAEYELILHEGQLRVWGVAGGRVHHRSFSLSAADDGRTFQIETLPQAAISGTVRDAAGRALGGVRVAAQPFKGLPSIVELRTDTTDAAGRYRITGLLGESALISVSTAGIELAELKATLKPGENEIDFTTTISGPTGPIEGVVVDRAGRPIEGAQVQVCADTTEPDPLLWGKPRETGPDGSFRFEAVAGGPVNLRAELADLAVCVANVVPGTRPVTIILPEVVTVRGTIPRSCLRARVLARAIELSHAQSKEAGVFRDGSFEFEVLAGAYRVFAYDVDFVTDVVLVDAREAPAKPILLRPVPSGRLRGEIEGFAHGRFVSVLEYKVESGEYEGLVQRSTMCKGGFLSPALPPGPVRLATSYREWADAEVVAGTTVDLGTLTPPKGE